MNKKKGFLIIVIGLSHKKCPQKPSPSFAPSKMFSQRVTTNCLHCWLSFRGCEIKDNHEKVSSQGVCTAMGTEKKHDNVSLH